MIGPNHEQLHQSAKPHGLFEGAGRAAGVPIRRAGRTSGRGGRVEFLGQVLGLHVGFQPQALLQQLQTRGVAQAQVMFARGGEQREVRVHVGQQSPAARQRLLDAVAQQPRGVALAGVLFQQRQLQH